MQISSRFTIAVHILLCIDTFQGKYKLTSEFLASSVHVTGDYRKILSQLKAAGIVEVQRGSGGASIVGKLEEISFLDIYRAVECVEKRVFFIFMKVPIPCVRWEEIFIRCWMADLSRYQNALGERT